MPRSLVSYWKRVATSGPTCDGREILPQHLRDIAETYTANIYTATIWVDHERWPGAHGTVFAVRLVETADDLAPGQIALEAQLKPNDKLLRLNDAGEKLFTSIEITPNFANTGKAYLTGLAVTDEPASLGTQELYFDKRTSQTAYFAASVELDSLGEDKPKGEMGVFEAMFTRLFQRFGLTDSEDTTPTTESNPPMPMDEATATACKAIRDQILVSVAGLDAIIEAAAAEAPEPDASLVDPTQQAVDEIVSTAEEQVELRRKARVNPSLAEAFSKLQNDFDALKNAPQARPLQRTVAPVAPAPTRKKVL